MAVKHNNPIPNVHFRQWWQRHVKCWYNQPAKAKKRALKRKALAAKRFPRPAAGMLRPVVRCPTVRYNHKIREGKGFSVAELKEAGVPWKKAQTIGIAVDHRRRNKSVEGMQVNVNRLKEYMSKLLVFPTGKKSFDNKTKKWVSKERAGDAKKSDLANVAQNTCKTVLPLPKEKKEKARAITSAEKEVQVFRILTAARRSKHKLGKYMAKLEGDKKEE